MSDANDEPRVVLLVTPRIALVLVAAIVAAFLVGGWRLNVINHNAIQREHAAQVAAIQREHAAQVAAIKREHMAQAAALQREKALSDAAVHEANVARCEAGNDFRRADLKRWIPIIFPALAAPAKTPTQQAQVNAFVNNTLVADRIVDCSLI